MEETKQPLSQTQIDDAKCHLYVALVQVVSTDDPIIVGHIRDALLALGGTLPATFVSRIDAPH
jgi:hypothetical protein